MNRKGEVAVILLIILSFVCLSLAALVYWRLGEVNKQNIRLSQQARRFGEEKKRLQEKVKDYKMRAARIKADLEQKEEEISRLKSSMRRESEGREQILSQVEALRNDLKSSRRENAELNKKIARSRNRSAEMEKELARLRQENRKLEDKLEQLASPADVQLGKIVVSAEAAPGEGRSSSQPGLVPAAEKQVDVSRANGLPAAGQNLPERDLSPTSTPAPSLPPTPARTAGQRIVQGNVILVNKEYEFVVMDIGRRQGLSAGDIFSVYHDNKYIGDVVLDRVDERMSSANFKDVRMKDIVAEGDRVIRR
ncbi:MAG: hypothetical protein ACE5GG_02920 [Candidatus Omnitrophota bacterium]